MKFLELVARGDTCQHLLIFSKHIPFQTIKLVSKPIVFSCMFIYLSTHTYISCIPIHASWAFGWCLVGTYSPFL